MLRVPIPLEAIEVLAHGDIAKRHRFTDKSAMVGVEWLHPIQEQVAEPPLKELGRNRGGARTTQCLQDVGRYRRQLCHAHLSCERYYPYFGRQDTNARL